MLNGIALFAENAGSSIDMTTALQNIMTAGTSVMGFISSTELLMTLFCGSIVGLACYFIRKVKHTAKA